MKCTDAMHCLTFVLTFLCQYTLKYLCVHLFDFYNLLNLHFTELPISKSDLPVEMIGIIILITMSRDILSITLKSRPVKNWDVILFSSGASATQSFLCLTFVQFSNTNGLEFWKTPKVFLSILCRYKLAFSHMGTEPAPSIIKPHFPFKNLNVPNLELYCKRCIVGIPCVGPKYFHFNNLDLLWQTSTFIASWSDCLRCLSRCFDCYFGPCTFLLTFSVKVYSASLLWISAQPNHRKFWLGFLRIVLCVDKRMLHWHHLAHPVSQCHTKLYEIVVPRNVSQWILYNSIWCIPKPIEL